MIKEEFVINVENTSYKRILINLKLRESVELFQFVNLVGKYKTKNILRRMQKKSPQELLNMQKTEKTQGIFLL